ncbi:hypothetical protein LZL87_012989 [Fusarium oxysporum]|nr:hypothetical protein LZL87_012989 [Fusarium oxysporum]
MALDRASQYVDPSPFASVAAGGIGGISEQRVVDTPKPQRATDGASQMVRGDSRLFAHVSSPKMELGGGDDLGTEKNATCPRELFDFSILDSSARSRCLPAAAEGSEL